MASADVSEKTGLGLAARPLQGESLLESSGGQGPDEDGSGIATQIPRADGGLQAWGFLASVFCLQMVAWGLPQSFGVFQDYYSTHDFAGSDDIPAIGTCSSAVMYLTIPLFMALIQKFPAQARFLPATGVVLICLSLVAASYARTIPHLIVSQGVLYGLGGICTVSPGIAYVNQWFDRRKGLAYGIMWAATGISGAGLPPLTNWLLETHGFRTTLRVFSVALFAVGMPFMCFVKPRLPPGPPARRAGLLPDLGFLASRRFLLFQVPNVVEALGFFLPAIYLPEYTRAAVGTTPFVASLTLLLNNLVTVASCIGMGWLVDRFHVGTCFGISAAGAVLATLLLWGALGSHLAAVYAFAVMYGLFAGSYTSVWTGVMRLMDGEADASLVFAFLSVGRGLGNLASGFLGEALVRGGAWEGSAVGGFGSGYGPLLVFTAASALVGGAGFLWRVLGWL